MPNITDVDILQYALTLEHLGKLTLQPSFPLFHDEANVAWAEDKFYREGLANFTLEHFKKAGYDDTFYNNLKEVSYDETTHVSFLTQALIGTPPRSHYHHTPLHIIPPPNQPLY